MSISSHRRKSSNISTFVLEANPIDVQCRNLEHIHPTYLSMEYRQCASGRGNRKLLVEEPVHCHDDIVTHRAAWDKTDEAAVRDRRLSV